jgi:hypothetical protein
MQLVGRWWATVPRNVWPDWQAESIGEDFNGEHGDRRQEIVFIGVDMNPARVASIRKALDWALLTDDEMARYDGSSDSLSQLSTIFKNPMPIRTPST